MANKSYLGGYELIDDEGHESLIEYLLENPLTGPNSLEILKIVLKSKGIVPIGTYKTKERIISLPTKIRWSFLKQKGIVEITKVTKLNLDSAMLRLNEFFERNDLPFRIGYSCITGNKKAKKGKEMEYKPEAPYSIGIVDIRRPKKGKK